MPHYLVRGARRLDATDVSLIVHAIAADEALRLAAEEGVLVSTFEALDEGEPEPRDAGQPSALMRVATRLKKAKRYPDAVSVMRQVHTMDDKAGVRHGSDLYLRIPRYLIEDRRFDEAWAYLGLMKLGQTPWRRLGDLLPHDLSEIHRLSARLLRAEHRERQAAIHDALTQIADIMQAGGPIRSATIIAELWRR